MHKQKQVKGDYVYLQLINKYNTYAPKTFIEMKIDGIIPTLNDNIPIWTDKRLMTMKYHVNNTKTLLDKYNQSNDDIIKWNKVSNAMRINNELGRYVKKALNGQYVTRAWLKFYELHSHYKTIPNTGKFKVFFNAELPGASICALNHLVKTLYPNIEYEWIASSFKPQNNDYEALGDQYGIYRKNINKWLMSEKNDGNMMKLANIIDYASKIGNTIDLYSHDAGVDVTADYNMQEIKNLKLHLGCALMGFKVLKNGGTFIAKQYSFYETISLNLICIYASMFEEFYVCKPMTSGYNNSELYLVGKKFKGMPKHIENILSNTLENWNERPLLQDTEIPKSSMDKLINIAQRLTNIQLDNINLSIDIYENIFGVVSYKTLDELITVANKLSYDLRPIQINFSKSWIRINTIQKIEYKDWVPSLENSFR
jgi:23S rRNA U2552 (ribose-2'-O)-methylase RlmE/FtsJ